MIIINVTIWEGWNTNDMPMNKTTDRIKIVYYIIIVKCPYSQSFLCGNTYHLLSN